MFQIGWIDIISDDIHAESTANIHKYTPNTAGSDDPDGFAVQIHARQADNGKIEIPGAVVCFVQFAIQGQKQRHGMFRHGIGRITRNPDNIDFFVRCFYIHIIIAGTSHGNHFYAVFIQAFNSLFVDIVIDKGADRVKPLGQFGCMLIEFFFEIYDFICVVEFFEPNFIIGFCIKKGDFFHGYFSRFVFPFFNPNIFISIFQSFSIRKKVLKLKDLFLLYGMHIFMSFFLSEIRIFPLVYSTRPSRSKYFIILETTSLALPMSLAISSWVKWSISI
jgi:hypothetical protein